MLNLMIIRLYRFITVLVPCLLVYFYFNKQQNQTGIKDPQNHLIRLLTFAVYFTLVLHVTGIGTIYDTLRGGMEINSEQLRLIPLIDIMDRRIFILDILNIIMMVPLGFMLPMIWPKSDNLKIIALTGFVFSLMIELSQLLNFRCSDVDDLIMNTLGAVLGFLLFRLINKNKNIQSKRINYIKSEPYVYMIAMFLGNFLLFNEIAIINLLHM